MKIANNPALAFGLAMLAISVLISLAVENIYLRYAGGLTFCAIGLGAIRRGLRVE